MNLGIIAVMAMVAFAVVLTAIALPREGKGKKHKGEEG